jgi:hypothetical protein
MCGYVCHTDGLCKYIVTLVHCVTQPILQSNTATRGSLQMVHCLVQLLQLHPQPLLWQRVIAGTVPVMPAA